VFGIVFELNTFDFLNIFSINFVIEWVIDGVVYFILSSSYTIPLFIFYVFSILIQNMKLYLVK